MKTATICFLIRNDEVCLGLKKRGFGEGKYNGFGGKVGDKEEFSEETIEESIKREGREEFDIEIKALEHRGVMEYVFPENPGWGQIVHVFISRDWDNEPKESEEMSPVWFKMSEIPYEQMWDDDKYWLPGVLEGKMINGRFEFDNEGLVTKQDFELTTEGGASKERK